MNCIFCQIVAGSIPCTKIYEDDLVLAFLDIAPVSLGHTLVVPKKHCDKIHNCDEKSFRAMTLVLPKIALAVSGAVEADGYNVLCNNGRAAGQLVDHLHFHIIPRMADDGVFSHWPAGKYPPGKADEIAQKIRENL